MTKDYFRRHITHPNTRWQAKLNAVGDGSYYVWETVFVAVGKLTKQRQLMVVSTDPSIWPPCPSKVRLKALDACDIIVAESPHVRVLVPAPTLSGGVDRELDERSFSERKPMTGKSCFDDGKLIRQGSQRRTEAMHYVAALDAYGRQEGPQTIGYGYGPKDVMAGVRIKLGPDLWSIAFDGRILRDVAFQSISVLFSPIEFCPAAVE
jgi:hypothetical protein